MTLVYFLDKDQSVMKIIDDLKSGTEDNKINAANELNIELYFSRENQSMIDKARYIAIPAHGKSIDCCHLYTISSYVAKFESINVTAYESVYDDMKDTWAPKIWGIVYVDELLNQLVDFLPFKNSWKIGNYPAHTSYEPLAYEDEDISVSDILSKAVTNWGFEFDFTFDLSMMKVTNRYINVYSQIGSDRTDLRFDLSTDFNDVQYTKDYSGIYTALVGYGSEYTVDYSETPTLNDQFVNHYVSGTIKIIVPSAQMVNRDLKPYTDRTLALDSEWRTDLYMYRESDQSKYYRVSTNQYVISTACSFNGQDDDSNGNDSGTSTGSDTKTFVTDFSQIEWTAGDNPVSKPKGQGYVEITGSTEQYGYSDGTPRIGIAKFSDEISSERLLSRTYLKLLQVCTPSIKFDSGFNHFPSDINLGDTIYLYEENLDIYVEERITEIKIDLVNIDDSKLTVGKTFAITPEERYSGIADYAKSNYKKYS